jgi:AcrR family transcriptional regulator
MNSHSIRAGRRPTTSGEHRPGGDDKRRRVMTAALEEFASRGYHGTTVPDVAARAGVATGTLYHYFETKEQLVNEVYRDTKLRMRSALLDGLADPIVDRSDSVEAWFLEVWRRLAAFERAEPAAFRFLEMREHFDYLDRESQQLELATVLPVFAVAQRVEQQADGARADLVIALSYGAFVGLVKASRLRYVTLDEASVAEAGRIAWKMFAPQAVRSLTGGD